MNSELEKLAKERGIIIVAASAGKTALAEAMMKAKEHDQQILVVGTDCPNIPEKVNMNKIELASIPVQPIFPVLSGRESRRNNRKHKSKRLKNKRLWKK